MVSANDALIVDNKIADDERNISHTFYLFLHVFGPITLYILFYFSIRNEILAGHV